MNPYPTRSLLAVLASGCIALAAQAADHREAPLVSEDPTADIADVYAFANPNDPGELIVAMTVNPFSIPAEAISYRFSENVEYTFHFDNDGDARSDRRIQVRFGPATGPQQTLVAELPDGTTLAGTTTAPTEAVAPNDPVVNVRGDVRLFAGPRDDPFFFDVVGFFRFLDGSGTFTGSDGFAGTNVSAIVVGLPVGLVRNADPERFPRVDVWATTARRAITLRKATGRPLVDDAGDRKDFRFRKTFGRFRQIERMGNPAVATALVPSELKDVYNVTQPRNDASDFAPVLVSSLQALGTPDANIGVLASVAVPDTLKLDPSRPSGFPNGRRLEDDVIDTLLSLILDDPGAADGVFQNDVPFLPGFPFLAPPQQPL